jgi:hypothetical protein
MTTERLALADRGEADDLRYYLDDYSDEAMPCDGTLEAWAEWLSQPDPDWGRVAAVEDGQQFACGVQRGLPDIIATREPSGWTFSREPDERCTLLAVRWGEGMGWSPDNIIWGEDMSAALREWFEENDLLCDDTEFVSIALDQPSIIVTYHAGPAPHLVASTVQ